MRLRLPGAGQTPSDTAQGEGEVLDGSGCGSMGGALLLAERIKLPARQRGVDQKVVVSCSRYLIAFHSSLELHRVQEQGAGSVPFHVDLQPLDPQKFHEGHLRESGNE